MATQTVPAPEQKLPLTFDPIAPGHPEQLSPEVQRTVSTALNMLRVWIAAVEASASINAPDDDDMDALCLSVGHISELLHKVQDNTPFEYAVAKSSVRNVHMYLSALIQRTEINAVELEALADVGAYSYRQLAGVLAAGGVQ